MFEYCWRFCTIISIFMMPCAHLNIQKAPKFLTMTVTDDFADLIDGLMDDFLSIHPYIRTKQKD